MIRIVLVSGSVRRESVNGRALSTLRDLLDRRDGEFGTSLLSTSSLPYYDQDVDDAGLAPAPVTAARELLAGADALIISTPSYNGSMPGVLKNALDWLSRPWGDSALTGLPTAILSASPGRYGAADAQPVLRTVLERAGAELVDHPQVAIALAEEIACLDGRFVEPSVVAALDSLLDATLAAAADALIEAGALAEAGASGAG